MTVCIQCTLKPFVAGALPTQVRRRVLEDLAAKKIGGEMIRLTRLEIAPLKVR
jgi:hypothetical protein